MIRTFITPTQSNYNFALEFPEEYLGQELEIIVFKKQEGLVLQKKDSNIKLSEKYKNVFTKEDSKSFINHSLQMRSEWENI